MQACLYILFSQALNKYYIGSTTDIERRLAEHNRGKEKFTRTGIPWLLVYSEIFEELNQARQREFYIKRMKSKIFIEKLITSAG
ncbi:MAG: GIY-YIG nuclease family protein [Ferruginibacter sp.]|nr:GIY-YIG nuclease family protein [Ferruginibacter sp.]